MNITVEIIIAGMLALFVLFETIFINIFKKDKNALLTGMVSLLSVLFGLYLCMKNGLILDYGTEQEIIKSHAFTMYVLGVANFCIGLLFIGISFIKYIIWQTRKVQNKSRK